MSYLTQPEKTARVLFYYWVATAMAFVAYEFFLQQDAHTNLADMLSIPGVVLAFVAACMSLILAASLRTLTTPNFQPVLRPVLWLMVAQQLITGNLPGAALCGVLLWRRPLWPMAQDNRTPVGVVIGVGVFLILITVLVAIAQVNMFVS